MKQQLPARVAAELRQSEHVTWHAAPDAGVLPWWALPPRAARYGIMSTVPIIGAFAYLSWAGEPIFASFLFLIVGLAVGLNAWVNGVRRKDLYAITNHRILLFIGRPFLEPRLRSLGPEQVYPDPWTHPRGVVFARERIGDEADASRPEHERYKDLGFTGLRDPDTVANIIRDWRSKQIDEAPTVVREWQQRLRGVTNTRLGFSVELPEEWEVRVYHRDTSRKGIRIEREPVRRPLVEGDDGWNCIEAYGRFHFHVNIEVAEENTGLADRARAGKFPKLLGLVFGTEDLGKTERTIGEHQGVVHLAAMRKDDVALRARRLFVDGASCSVKVEARWAVVKEEGDALCERIEDSLRLKPRPHVEA
jgi:hypothetical protein